jgi:hypothetical protein
MNSRNEFECFLGMHNPIWKGHVKIRLKHRSGATSYKHYLTLSCKHCNLEFKREPAIHFIENRRWVYKEARRRNIRERKQV